MNEQQTTSNKMPIPVCSCEGSLQPMWASAPRSLNQKDRQRQSSEHGCMEQLSKPYLWAPQCKSRVISLVLLTSLHPYHLGRTVIEIYIQLILMM